MELQGAGVVGAAEQEESSRRPLEVQQRPQSSVAAFEAAVAFVADRSFRTPAAFVAEDAAFAADQSFQTQVAAAAVVVVATEVAFAADQSLHIHLVAAEAVAEIAAAAVFCAHNHVR